MGYSYNKKKKKKITVAYLKSNLTLYPVFRNTTLNIQISVFPNSFGKYCIFLRVKVNKRSPDFFNRYQLFKSLNDKNEHKVKD